VTIRRQLLTSILLAGVPLLVLHAYTIVYQYGSEKRRILERNMEAAQTIASLMQVAVTHLVEQHQAVGRLIAQEPHRRREALAWVRKSSPLVVRAGLFRPDGRGMILDPATPRNPKDVNISDRPHFRALLQGADWAISDLLIGRGMGEPIVTVAIAVRHPSGSLEGVLSSVIRPEAFVPLLRFKVEEGTYFGIVDRSGRVISSSLFQDVPWEKRDWSREPGVANALAGMPTPVERFVHPLGGTPLMGAWVPLPALGWAVGVMVDLDREMKSIQRAGVVQIGSLAAVVLLSLVMGLKLAGQLSRPITGLARAARKLGQGDLAQRVEVRGTAEVSALGEAFNRMVEDIGSSHVALTKQTEELKRKALELQGLYELSCQLESALRLEDLLELALVKVREMTGSDLALISVQDEDSGRVIVRSDPRVPERDLRAAPQVRVEQWREEPLVVNGFTARHALSALAPIVGDIESLIAVPLRANGRAVGTITLTSTAADRFTEQDIPFLSSMASLLAVAVDRTRLYAQTRKDAEAKALLVRELDHRVRNNLVTITGLLSMELGRKRHLSADEALKICIDRVQSLAAIHDLLVQDGFRELDLERLVEAVARAAAKGLSSEEHVEIRAEAPPIRLPAKCLFALALTVNELLTNVLKHAFRSREGGRVEIRVRDEGEEMQLEVRDNGVGIPVVSEEGRGRGVGLEIVTSLVHIDLRGEFRLRNEGGTVATVRFPKPQDAES
jgi:two-component sensor histidine kinase/HAMP domain-containing protein